MKLLKIQFLLIFAGLLFAAPVFADTSTRGCETNTMKSGEFCNWAEGKSWCAGNTLTCAVESTTPCPANPANGTYAFSCNSNSCVLSCNSGYTNCSGTCTINGSLPNCTTYNTCTGVCTTCAAGYTWNGSACAAATLRLGSTSVSGATSVVQAATNPQLFISGTTVGLGISNPTANLHLVSNTNTEGLRIISSNYSPFIIRNTADTEDLFRIDQDGNITSKGSLTGSNSFWNIDGSNLYASSTSWNVGIGITNPTEKLTVVGAINSNSTVNGVSLCIAGDCKTSWGDAGWSFDGNTVGQVKSFGTLDNYAVPFLSNGTERMRLTETGNFVIGATSTGVRLHVESPQGAVAFFKSKLNGGSYAGYIGNGQTFTGEEFGLYYALNDQRMATYNLTNSLLLYGGHLSSDAALAINAAGNVGIGTTNPGYKLDVNGIIKTNNRIMVESGNGTTAMFLADEYGVSESGLYSGGGYRIATYHDYDSVFQYADGAIYASAGNIGIGTTNPSGKLDVSAGLASQTAGDLVVNTTNSTVYVGKLDSVSGNTTFIFRDRLGNQKSKWFNAGAGSIFFGNMISPGYGIKIQASNVTGIADNATTSAKLEVNSESTTFPSAVFMGGNVGIGTTTPGNNLHIVRNVANDFSPTLLRLQSIGSASSAFLQIDRTSNARMAGINYALSGVTEWFTGTYYNGGSGQTNFGIGTDYQITNQKFVITNSGNVGINTTNPGAKLEVVGTFRVNGALNSVVLDRLSGTGNRIVMADASGSLYATSSSVATGLPAGTTGQTLRSDGTNWLPNSVIYNNGTNVGIGVVPTTKLDVNGNLAVRGDNIILGSYDENSSQSGLIDGDVYPYVMRFKINTDDSGYSWGWTHRKVSDGTETHAMLLTPSGSRASLKVDSNITAGPLTGAMGTIPVQTTYVKLGAAGSSETSYFNAGNVGVGVTSPTRKLQIDTNGAGLYVAGAGESPYSQNIAEFYYKGNGNSLLIKQIQGQASITTGGPSQNLYLSTNGANSQLTINATTGYVGIGTTTPMDRLSVSGGNILINDAVINSGTPKAAITKEYLDSALSTAASNWNLSGSNLYASSTSWNVGIGTTSPSQKLHVSGGNMLIDAGNMLYLRDTTTYINEGSGLNLVAGSGRSINLSGGTGVDMTIASTGNVGIGTTTPGAKLEVSGNIRTTIDNALPNLVMDSSGSGDNWTSQGAYISLGESGALGSAALHLTYIGNGTSYIGSGAVTAGVPAQSYLRFAYDSKNIYTDSNLQNAATGNSYFMGNLGIGTTSPATKLSVSGGNILINDAAITSGTPKAAITKEYLDSALAVTQSAYWNLSGSNLYASSTSWNVGIGTTSPTAKLHVIGNAVISTTLTMGGDINMGNNNITNLNKLTVNTIDPLYNIKGINYSTFAASIVGGVKEEYVGRIKLARLVDGEEYEAVVDFDQVKEGSDLWVWRHTVDFSADNVQVLITPYGGFAEVYYEITGNSLVLRADRPADVSYRLIGKRIDWRQWPTKAKDQKEKAGFVID